MGLKLFKRRRKDALLLADDGGDDDGRGDGGGRLSLAVLRPSSPGDDGKADADDDDRTARTSTDRSSAGRPSPARAAGKKADADAGGASSGAGGDPGGAAGEAAGGGAGRVGRPPTPAAASGCAAAACFASPYDDDDEGGDVSGPPDHGDMSPVNVSDITSSSTVVAASTTLELGDSQLASRPADGAAAAAPPASTTPAASPAATAGVLGTAAGATPSPGTRAAMAEETPRQSNLLPHGGRSTPSSSSGVAARPPALPSPSVTFLETSRVDDIISGVEDVMSGNILAGRSDENVDLTNSLLETTGSTNGTAGWTESLETSGLTTLGTSRSLTTLNTSRSSATTVRASPGKKKKKGSPGGGAVRGIKPPRRDTRAIRQPAPPAPAGRPPRPSPENSVDLGLLANINTIMDGDNGGDGEGVEMELKAPPAAATPSPVKGRRNLSSLFNSAVEGDKDGEGRAKAEKDRRGKADGARKKADRAERRKKQDQAVKKLGASFQAAEAGTPPSNAKQRKAPSKQSKQKSAKKSSGKREGGGAKKKSPGAVDKENNGAAAVSPEKRGGQKTRLGFWRRTSPKTGTSGKGAAGAVPLLTIGSHRDDVSLLTVPEVRGGAPGSVRSGSAATDAGVRGRRQARGNAAAVTPEGGPSFAPPVGPLGTVDEASAESSLVSSSRPAPRSSAAPRSAAAVSPATTADASPPGGGYRLTADDILADMGDDVLSGTGAHSTAGGDTTTYVTGPSTTAAAYGGIDRILGALTCGTVDGGMVADAIDELRCDNVCEPGDVCGPELRRGGAIEAALGEEERRVSAFQSEIVHKGIKLIYHESPARASTNPNWIQSTVRLFLRPGDCCNSRSVRDPRLAWAVLPVVSRMKAAGGGTAARGGEMWTTLGLADIHSVLSAGGGGGGAAARRRERRGAAPPSPSPGDGGIGFFSVISSTGAVYVFEAPSAGERDRIVAGLGSLMSRLARSIVSGDAEVIGELYSEDAGQLTGELPSLVSPWKALGRVTHAFLDQQ